MPIELPNLDDRKYVDLVEEGLSLIPTHAPDWTNHNPSDPGVTLVELFAYFAELLNYRINRIGKENMLSFLRLLNGPEWQEPKNPDLNTEIRKAILELRRRNRAVTCEDYEVLAMEADARVARAKCVAGRNLRNPTGPNSKRPGQISVVVMPRDHINDTNELNALFKKVEGYLEDKRLLTTRVSVFQPSYLGDEEGIGIRLVVTLKSGALEETLLFSIGLDDLNLGTGTNNEEMLEKLLVEFKKEHEISDDVSFRKLEEKRWLIIDNGKQQTYTVRQEQEETSLHVYKDAIRTEIMRSLWKFFHPLIGGVDGSGWPFGREVYVSEVYQIVDSLPGVDFVTKMLSPDNGKLFDELFVLNDNYTDRVQRNEKEELVAIEVAEYELVRLIFNQIYIVIKRPRTQ